MVEHYKMWVKSECPYCVQARDELISQRARHTVFVMDDNLGELQEIQNRWDHQTVPLIVLEQDEVEKLIGGCDDLKEWFGDKNDG